MKELIIVRGLPGSGKSTFAKLLGGIHIEADQYWMENGVYNFDITKLHLAHSYCLSQTRAWMEVKSDQLNTDRVVVSNTFTMEKEMQPYFDLAKELGYRVYTIIVENRHGGVNVHDVPDETLKKMADRFTTKLI